MSKVKCFDVVSELVCEANKQFAPIWKLDEEKYDIIKNYCEALDKLIEEFDGESIDVEIDDTHMTVIIALEFYDMVVESPNHLFYKLADRSIGIKFSQETEDLIKVEFMFPSLWNRTL